MGRGQLTEQVAEKARDLLGRDITVAELRLMPYVQYTMMNDQRLDPNKCNSDDRKVLSLWREEGHIEGGAGGLSMTKDFWDILNEIMWLSYVRI